MSLQKILAAEGLVASARPTPHLIEALDVLVEFGMPYRPPRDRGAHMDSVWTSDALRAYPGEFSLQDFQDAWELFKKGKIKLASYTGNPDGEPIYDHKIDHGYKQPLSGGTDVMKRLVDQFRIEQGSEPREKNPRLGGLRVAIAYLKGGSEGVVGDLDSGVSGP